MHCDVVTASYNGYLGQGTNARVVTTAIICIWSNIYLVEHDGFHYNNRKEMKECSKR